MERVKFGIVGLGTIGESHFNYLVSGQVPGADITGICVRNQDKAKWGSDGYPNIKILTLAK